MRTAVINPSCVVGNFHVVISNRSARLHHGALPAVAAGWEADAGAAARCLLQDGTVVVTPASGEFCVLNLYQGNRRLSLLESEAILPW